MNQESKALPFIITKQSVTVNCNGDTRTVYSTNPLYEKVILAIKAGKWEDIPELMRPEEKIKEFSNGTFTVRDGQVFIGDSPVPELLGQRILEFAEQELPYQPLVRFFENLNQNPSFRAVQGLYRFLEANHFPITDNGLFLAYKGVKKDFTDCHTGKFDNSVGQVVEVPRNQVDEDPERTCSNGLHVASYNYAHNHYGSGSGAAGVTVEVLVNPRDVVAVPRDYNDSKMRVCRYEVVGISKGEHKDQLFRTESEESEESNYTDEDDSDDEAYCGNCDELVYNCTCECCEECGDTIYDCNCPEE